MKKEDPYTFLSGCSLSSFRMTSHRKGPSPLLPHGRSLSEKALSMLQDVGSLFRRKNDLCSALIQRRVDTVVVPKLPSLSLPFDSRQGRMGFDGWASVLGGGDSLKLTAYSSNALSPASPPVRIFRC